MSDVDVTLRWTRVSEVALAHVAKAASALGVVFACGCAGLAPVSEPREVVRGPLPTRALLPQALAFPEPRPRRVRTQRLGTFGGGLVASVASFDGSGDAGTGAFEDDTEVLHTALLTRYGIDGNKEIEVELAASATSSEFTGAPWEREEDELAMMDVPVHVTQILRPPAGGLLGMAVRGGVELPLGDEDEGTGSGGFDYDLGVLFERSRGRWTLTGGLDLVCINTPDSYAAAGVRPEDLCIGSFGAEFRWNDATSLLGGLRYRTQFTDDLAADEVDEPVLDLALGMTQDAGAGRWFAALHEDVLVDSGRDFSVSFGYLLGF